MKRLSKKFLQMCEKKRTSFANRGRQMKTLSGTGEDLRGWDSREQSGSGIFCLVIEARTFKFSLVEQKGCDIFCNVMDGLFWTCRLFRCDSYSSYVPLRFPRSLVWFKHNQLWIPVCRLWEAHLGFLPDSECRWLSDSPCIHSHRSRLISSLKLACSIAWFVKGDFERFW